MFAKSVSPEKNDDKIEGTIKGHQHSLALMKMKRSDLLKSTEQKWKRGDVVTVSRGVD